MTGAFEGLRQASCVGVKLFSHGLEDARRSLREAAAQEAARPSAEAQC